MGIQGRGPQYCTSRAGEWGSPVTVTLSATGEAVLSGAGWYKLNTYDNAASDALVKISGLAEGDEVLLSPFHDDRTITLADSTYIRLNRDIAFTMDNILDSIPMQCIDASNNYCREIGTRVSGGE